MIGCEYAWTKQKYVISLTHRGHPGVALRLLICLSLQLIPTPGYPLSALSISLPEAQLWVLGSRSLLVLPGGEGGWTDIVFGLFVRLV